MASLVPQLVRDADTGLICLMISLGSETIVEPLPDKLATASGLALQEYLQSIVPEMIERLKAQRQQKLRKFKKKAADA